MLFERLGKSRRRLIANAGRNPGDGVVARFEHECRLVHPTRDEVTVHGLADKPGKASREGRAAEPHMAPQRAKGPWLFGVLVDQLKRQRQQVSGVSLDEETTHLIQYQHAYQAAARVISIVDGMLDTLINHTKA